MTAEAVDFLTSHGIPEFPDAQEREVRNGYDARLRTGDTPGQFTIRLQLAPQANRAKVWQSLGGLLGQMRGSGKPEGIPHLNVKLMWNGFNTADLALATAEVIGFTTAYAVGSPGIVFYGEFPIDVVAAAVEDLKRFTQPTLHINAVLTGDLSPEHRGALLGLVGDGFRPHVVFRVAADWRARVAAAMESLADDLGPDGFTFALMPVDRRGFENDREFEAALPKRDDLLGLCDLGHSLPNVDLEQSWLYRDLRARVTAPGNIFPCRACAGRAVFIDAEGGCAHVPPECRRGSRQPAGHRIGAAESR